MLLIIPDEKTAIIIKIGWWSLALTQNLDETLLI